MRQAGDGLAFGAGDAHAEHAVATVVLDGGQERAVGRERPGLHVAMRGREHRGGLARFGVNAAQAHEVRAAMVGQAHERRAVRGPADRGVAGRAGTMEFGRGVGREIDDPEALIAGAVILDEGEPVGFGVPASNAALAKGRRQHAGGGSGSEVHDQHIELALIPVIRGVGDPGAIGRPGAEIVHGGGGFGERARGRCAVQKPELLPLVAAGVDAPDQPVIGRAAAQERNLLVMSAECAGVSTIAIHHPNLRQAGSP